ncbi:glycosyltransferase family 4 protein [Massilia sp. CT11-137]|uniref:glycosyltransferase family 4 protein n=1 Tax=Massilia sp. CT11-137 TaxID=3393901 RepID=UPI0039A6C6F7
MRSENQTIRYRIGVIANTVFSLINFRGPLIKAMSKRGMTVYAFAPDYDERTREAVRALGATPVDYSLARAGMNPFRDFADLLKLARQLRELELDASFSYFIKPVIYGTLAACLAGIPRRVAMIEGVGYVFTEGERFGLRRRVLRTLVVQLYKVALKQTQRVFMLNPDDRKMFVELGMVDPGKVRLLNGIGVDLDQFIVEETSAETVSFILIARLLKEKGVYDYIEAARIVRRQYPRVRFTLLGSVDLNPGSISQEEVRAWVDEELIEWPGHVHDVKPWIAQASVFVLPSYREGLPRSTQEVMAMGKPVITTDVPGCRETVEDGVNGFKVPVRDPAALAEAMLTFIRSPHLVAPMGRASRRKAEQTFDVHKINAEILEAMGI